MRRLLHLGFRSLCGLALLACWAGLPGTAGAQSAPAGTQHSVTLAWQAPGTVGGSGTIKGYNVYRSPSGPPVFSKVNPSLVAGLTTVDTSVAQGTTYAYCATTVDSNNSESACSIQVTANVPSNPNPPQAFTGTTN